MSTSALKHIFLYGPPGSGKSTLGAALAEKLERCFIDLDAHIEENSGQPIAEIFSQWGESAFRRAETQQLTAICHKKEGCVVALGGGTLHIQHNRELAEASGVILCLMDSAENLLQHVQLQQGQRPLLIGDTRQRLQDLLAARAEHYASFNAIHIDNRAVPLLLDEIQRRLGIFRVSGMGASYDVIVQNGSLTHIGSYLQQRGLRGPLVVVSDSNVAPFYASSVLASLQVAGYQASLTSIPAGEAHKTLQTTAQLWQTFLEHGVERTSTVVALGGGVVSDLAGFAAAAYLRGVPWVACPTTLLAMADAGVGGKTGVDLPQGKNLVGAFHAPTLVLSDPLCLQTLPLEEQRNGLAEVLKHGVIQDSLLFEMAQQPLNRMDWESLVRRAVQVKVNIICEDPYERGRRAALNLGHSIGHAIELVSGFQLKHGEAVGVGMLAEARLAVLLGLADASLPLQIAAALRNIGLATQIPTNLDIDEVLQAMQHDKKKAGGKVKFALPLAIGSVQHGILAETSLVVQVLTETQAMANLT